MFPQLINQVTLTATGLLLDIIGIIALFWLAPEKYPDPQSTVSFKVEPSELRDRWRKNNERRKVVAGIGVSAMVLGFALQFIAVVAFREIG